MIISEFYQTKIEVVKSDTTTSYYNVNIDATDVQVIVSLIDFNGAPVTGKSVTLKCDNGYFTKYGSGTSTSSLTATGNTTTKSITATTDSNGKISATYTASEWGLATFSTNTTNTQIRVDGWKFIQQGNLEGVMVDMYSNGKYGYFTCQKTSSVNLSTGSKSNFFPNDLIPNISSTMLLSVGSTNKLLIQQGTGDVYVQANTPSEKRIHIGCIYPLANPKY